tara:strand:+ start:233 stop:844 length:612 start_codon:yes stop_codon:yes gene_type:complete
MEIPTPTSASLAITQQVWQLPPELKQICLDLTLFCAHQNGTYNHSLGSINLRRKKLLQVAKLRLKNAFKNMPEDIMQEISDKQKTLIENNKNGKYPKLKIAAKTITCIVSSHYWQNIHIIERGGYLPGGISQNQILKMQSPDTSRELSYLQRDADNTHDFIFKAKQLDTVHIKAMYDSVITCYALLLTRFQALNTLTTITKTI